VTQQHYGFRYRAEDNRCEVCKWTCGNGGHLFIIAIATWNSSHTRAQCRTRQACTCSATHSAPNNETTILVFLRPEPSQRIFKESPFAYHHFS